MTLKTELETSLGTLAYPFSSSHKNPLSRRGSLFEVLVGRE